MNLKIATFGLTSMILVTACSNDEIEKINLGNEITFNTRVSTRANVMTTGDLTEFNLWADAEGYNTMFLKGEKVTKPANSSYFSFSRAVYWPSEVSSIQFWGVAPTDVNVGLSGLNPHINGFTPAADAKDQIDLITAYTVAKRADGTNVNINFHHALSQIEVWAKEGVEDKSKKVLIKGAWIVNVAPSGNLLFVPSPEGIALAEASNDATKHMNWTPVGDKTKYGREFPPVNPVWLRETAQPLLADGELALNSNLMLVPQQLGKWDLNSADKSKNDAGGAYILLLCRVELVHPGKDHPGSDVQIGVGVDEDEHYHQLFPNTGKYDKEEYGYTCVPISDNWEPGKKYVYTLQFCGATSGAGVYPPTSDLTTFNLPDGNGKYIKTIPSGKGIGDPVLDQSINFTVTVLDWDKDNAGWTNGNIQMQ